MSAKALFAALVLAALFAFPASTANDGDYVVVGEDQEGFFVKTVAASDYDGYAVCGGNAPNTVTCTNGVHATPVNAAHGFLVAGYTGYISSTLTDDVGNTRFMSCTVVNGQTELCSFVGEWPVGPWSQTCLAHGAGGWECWSDHI